ncbi:MAG: hypothetical protein K8H88_14250, partial [Sandaracinaceae bacterium]|nr:hypothetical protein [Sandaracinaceae bacterium]
MRIWPIALLLCACSEPSPVPLPSMGEVALPEGGEALRGSIAGSNFALRDARFRVVDAEHRRRVDLVFADRAIERCGLPIHRPETTVVWARLPDRASVETGPFELEGEPGDLEVHYERPDGRAFVTSHRAVARLRIESVEPNAITGRMRACFADEDRSCVGGTFTARPCFSRIDGRAIREPPG